MAYNIKPNNKKQYTFWPLLYVVFFLFASTLAVSIFRLGCHYYTQRQTLEQKKKEVQEQQKGIERYRLLIKRAQTDEYIEAEARRLELARENETVVVGAFPTPTPRPTPFVDRTPVYRQWYNLFQP